MLWPDTSAKETNTELTLQRKISTSGLVTGVLLLTSFLLHLLLIGLGWPLTNSDEGTMGMMALHIAYQGTHPTFFYGQNYMGSWEALLGAGLFHILGPSLFALRLGTVCMFMLFLGTLYLLSCLLFTRTWAQITVLLVGTGSGFMITQEVRAIGGYSETLFFGALLFLCVTWLVLTYQSEIPLRTQRLRYLVYLLWGLTAGVGLWTDLLIAPAILASGLLLLLGCRREMLRLIPLACLLVGLCAGAFPLIYYNLHAAPGQDSLSVLRGLDGSGIQTYMPATLSKETGNTFQISVPLMTGEPFCPVTEIPFLGPDSPPSQACTAARSIWSAVYLLLFALALGLAGYDVWSHRRRSKHLSDEPDITDERKKQLARLFLLVSGLLSLALYTFSNGPLSGPGLHARYLICLLIITPAVFWPLWRILQSSWRRTFLQKAARICAAVVLCCFCSLSLLGSALAFTEVPAAAALNQQDANLINTLEHSGIRHIYTDYWTCDKIAFESNEHVICAVISPKLQISTRYSRYTPYIAQVRADPHAVYVLPTNPQQFIPDRVYAHINDPHQPFSRLPMFFRNHYTRVIINGYVLFLRKS